MDKDIKKLFETITGLVPKGCKAYAVGGTVRDIILGRACSDIDLAVSCPPAELARAIAGSLGGSAFVMDETRDVYRVALGARPRLQVDVSPLKGSIQEDLAARDFTVNAMAVRITGAMGQRFEVGEIMDPFGGLADLKAGVIRVIGERTFKDDPLRLLRAFRLSAQLGFIVDEKTLAMVGGLVHEIRSVSPERIRDELYMMLEGTGTEKVLRELHAHGLLAGLFPEAAPMEGLRQGGPHAYDLLEHSIRTAGYAESVMAEPGRWFGENTEKLLDYLRAPADGGVTMYGIVKLCALLHDVGKPSTMKTEGGRTRFHGHDEVGAETNGMIASRLRVSDRVRDTLIGTARFHMRPLHLSREALTRRAVHRLARDAGSMLPALAVVALADAFATRDTPDENTTDVEGAVATLVEYYFGDYMEASSAPLLSGHDLIGLLGLEPGPLIGVILRDVEEKRAEGELADRDGALSYVRENLEKYLR